MEIDFANHYTNSNIPFKYKLLVAVRVYDLFISAIVIYFNYQVISILNRTLSVKQLITVALGLLISVLFYLGLAYYILLFNPEYIEKFLVITLQISLISKHFAPDVLINPAIQAYRRFL